MITVLIGISGSGKSTFARELANTNGSIIVNRDKIREMIFGYSESNIHEYYKQESIKESEKLVTNLLNDTIESLLADGKSIIIDNTHLNKKYLDDIVKNWQRFTDIEFKIIHCDLTVAIERDSARNRKVGPDIIKSQHNQFKELMNSNYDFSKRNCLISIIEQDLSLPPCVIFDIDGTLAEKGNRNPFNWKECINDTLRKNVADLFHLYEEDGFSVIICTGRDGCCESETLQWLITHNLHPNEFHIRKTNDTRPDWQIKEEFWRDISTRFNIKLLIDDRNQVVSHSRNLGIEVFQVQPGKF